METIIQKNLQEIGKIIGKTEYNNLVIKQNLFKSGDSDEDLTLQEKANLLMYEDLQNRIEEGKLKNAEFLRSLVGKKNKTEKPFLEYPYLKSYFTKYQIEKYSKPFSNEMDINISTVLLYFSKDKRFFKSPILYKKLNNPNFDKGLLIIGGYGNGKTTFFLELEKIFRYSQQTFKSYTTNEIVEMYEGCENEEQLNYLKKSLKNGNRYFDDLCTEREASRYGKVNVLKDIIEARYNESKIKPQKTFLTMNYSKDNPNDVERSLDVLDTKYGGRVYDRIFEMFNIIHWQGKSLRK